MANVIIDDPNYTGLYADITYCPIGGSPIYLGNHQLPFTWITTIYDGTGSFVLYYPSLDITCGDCPQISTSTTTSSTSTTTTINPCACITFTNNDPVNSQFVLWDICPGVMAFPGYTIPPSSTFKACGSNPRSDSYPPGIVTWTIGGPCDTTNAYPTCVVPKCYTLTSTIDVEGEYCTVTYYDMYGIFQTLNITTTGVTYICAQEGSINVTCSSKSAETIVTGGDVVCTSEYDCQPPETTTTTTTSPSTPQRCTAFGTTAAYRMEGQWNDEQTPNPPDGIYTFEIVELTLNGISYGVGSTITITNPPDLVTGPGVFGGTYVQNINDWINSIPGVSTSGFEFYDDMSTVDVPDVSSTFKVVIKRTTVRIGEDYYYKWERDVFGTTGFGFNGSLPVLVSCYSGCYTCTNL